MQSKKEPEHKDLENSLSVHITKRKRKKERERGREEVSLQKKKIVSMSNSKASVGQINKI